MAMNSSRQSRMWIGPARWFDPSDLRERNEEEQAQWLLVHILDFHRREAKAPWWEFFRLRDLPEEELLDEKAAVVRLGVSL
jgi:hypothetical protein